MSNTTTEVLNRVKISDVYQALGGPKLRKMRGPAFWRNGDGFNVSMDDARGLWHDFTANEGGGVLELVVQVRGGNRADALRWCADLAGVAMDDTPLSAEDRKRWAEERRMLERDLPAARYWRRAAVALGEETLDRESSRLIDPTQGPADLVAMRSITTMLAPLRAMSDASLVTEYRWWLQHYPGMTAAMVRAARQQEQAAQRMVLAYLAMKAAA